MLNALCLGSCKYCNILIRTYFGDLEKERQENK
ncbi:hypothetical protein AAZX31_10G236300 [Glycine max]